MSARAAAVIHTHVLGPHTEHHRLPWRRSRTAKAVARKSDGDSARCEARPIGLQLDHALDEIHAGTAEKGGNEAIRRPPVDFAGAPTCRMRPPCLMAIRVASVSASIWSWVT